MRPQTPPCLVCGFDVTRGERVWRCGRCFTPHHLSCVQAHDRCAACGGVLLATSTEVSGVLTTLVVAGVVTIALVLSYGLSGPRWAASGWRSHGVVVRRR
ncbi:MAG TPA: hypothetical protein VFF73_03240 [Planctomycetota bacterium]|nr:hypothetical protein [Planctomycetota bacterium]